ncbi:MAG: hypothetical protein RBT80_19165 [Candidatus Vecturithrix sp.]|jgi:hypothetical protein|nr:hypothetical protein [Candidatus Vecturithrix sp.]
MTNGRHTRFLDALKRVFQVVTAPDFFDDFVDPPESIPGRTPEQPATESQQADEAPA